MFGRKESKDLCDEIEKKNHNFPISTQMHSALLFQFCNFLKLFFGVRQHADQWQST
jgi:hypothetical protein